MEFLTCMFVGMNLVIYYRYVICTNRNVSFGMVLESGTMWVQQELCHWKILGMPYACHRDSTNWNKTNWIWDEFGDSYKDLGYTWNRAMIDEGGTTKDLGQFCDGTLGSNLKRWKRSWMIWDEFWEDIIQVWRYQSLNVIIIIMKTHQTNKKLKFNIF